MDISAISGLAAGGGVNLPSAVTAKTDAARPEPASFSRLMTDILSETNQQQQQMNRDVENLALGKIDNIHQVVLNVAEADMMFRTLMEVRDRLISSYQEVMRMQI
jgi:flagellar hook-basal body complex protein FliE